VFSTFVSLSFRAERCFIVGPEARARAYFRVDRRDTPRAFVGSLTGREKRKERRETETAATSELTLQIVRFVD